MEQISLGMQITHHILWAYLLQKLIYDLFIEEKPK